MRRKPNNTPLRTVRRARTLTQEDLARLSGITQESLSRIERGQYRPPVHVQAILAAILGVGTEELFPREAVAS